MKAIYDTKGPAREYCPWACNLFRGCGHGCLYCYAPDVLRMDREEFHGRPIVRPGILDALKREAPSYRGEEVLLCFTCDPYQPIEAATQTTRAAIEILHAAGVKVNNLTKGGWRSRRDLDLLAKRPELSSYGATLVFDNDHDRALWEPGASQIGERIEILREAHSLGIPTWLSLEPVIEPEQTLNLIRDTHRFVEVFKVGKWNHDPHGAARINWRDFGTRAVRLLKELGKEFYIKHDLREAMARTAERSMT